MATKLTKRQKEVLALIQRRLEETGYPPTRAEIAREFGFRSANAAEEHLKALARKGVIEMIPGASRGIRILTPGPSGESGIKRLPIVGKVAAGHPILALEHIDDYQEVSPDIFNPRADYLLRVQGMSMKNAGILDGDLIAVHRTSQVRNGQIVVARLGDEVTVKRWEKTGNRIRLIPENDEFSPIEICDEAADLQLEGLAVGIIRQM